MGLWVEEKWEVGYKASENRSPSLEKKTKIIRSRVSFPQGETPCVNGKIKHRCKRAREVHSAGEVSLGKWRG